MENFELKYRVGEYVNPSTDFLYPYGQIRIISLDEQQGIYCIYSGLGIQIIDYDILEKHTKRALI